MATVRLPATFTPTHATAGLPGYPAIDVFAAPGSVVESGFWGKVRRISGRPLSGTETPGGAYGYSVYVYNETNGRERYVTHFGVLRVKVGDRVKPGTPLGTVAHPPDRETRVGTAHVHLGMRA